MIVVYYDRNNLNLNDEIDIEVEVLNFDDNFLQTLNELMCDVAQEYNDTANEAELLEYFKKNYVYELTPLKCSCGN